MIFIQQVIPSLGDLGISAPNVGLFSNYLIYFAIFILLCILIGVITVIFAIRKIYKRKIKVWARKGKRHVIIFKDRAKEVKLSNVGDYVFFLQKKKIPLPYNHNPTESNEYWYYQKKDGDIIPLELEDIDEKLGQLKVHSVLPDARKSYREMEDIFKNRFQNKNFWEKYAGIIAYLGLLVVVGIMTYLLFDKFLEITAGINSAVESMNAMMETQRQMLLDIENIRQGGSGFVPAT